MTLSGIDLARRLYEQEVRPRLGARPHAAALLGAGSEVLGLDDEVSTDHDFGPRVQIFLAPGTRAPELGADDRIDVTTAAGFFVALLGFDPVAGPSLEDWLVTPTQALATLTAGAVFHDPDGELSRRRTRLAWYPDDVWRYALAAGWLQVAQEEAFVARAGSTGDDLGSRVIAGRLVRELMRLAFLVERRWAPYPKWFGTAFARLRLAADIGPMLAEAVAAPDWRAREAALVTAASRIAAATNEIGRAHV